MELILLAILTLVMLGMLDRWLHPQPKPHATPRRAARRRTLQQRVPHRRTRRPAVSHRHSHAQARPFMSLDAATRRADA